MKQLGIVFEEPLVPFGDGAFYAFSPTGQVPCLEHAGRYLWDSLAIVEYLAERHEGVWPAGENERAWARCASAEMHSSFRALRDGCTMNCGLRIRIDSYPSALRRDIKRIDAIWNEGLTRFGGPYLAGASFTAVDAFFAPVAVRHETYGFHVSPQSARYAANLRMLPDLLDWCAAGISEPYRDPAHEEEAFAAGVVLADLRAR